MPTPDYVTFTNPDGSRIVIATSGIASVSSKQHCENMRAEIRYEDGDTVPVQESLEQVADLLQAPVAPPEQAPPDLAKLLATPTGNPSDPPRGLGPADTAGSRGVDVSEIMGPFTTWLSDQIRDLASASASIANNGGKEDKPAFAMKYLQQAHRKICEVCSEFAQKHRTAVVTASQGGFYVDHLVPRLMHALMVCSDDLMITEIRPMAEAMATDIRECVEAAKPPMGS